MERYLLGDLPEAGQLAMEQDYFADAETFEQVWAAENDLIDRYVRRQLPPRESALFERNYLQSPPHRARVALARNMLDAVECRVQRDSAPDSNRHAAAGRNIFGGLFASLTPSLGLRVALVASVIFGVTGFSWLAIDRVRMNGELEGLRSELARQRQDRGRIEQQWTDEREQGGRLRAEIGLLRQAPGGSPRRDGSRVVSLVLSPVLLRGTGARQQEIETTSSTKWIRLEIPLEGNRTASFLASVYTPEGMEVWSRRSVQPENDSLILEIPASSLPPGDYVVNLSPGRSAEAGEMDRYFFRVIRR